MTRVKPRLLLAEGLWVAYFLAVPKYSIAAGGRLEVRGQAVVGVVTDRSACERVLGKRFDLPITLRLCTNTEERQKAVETFRDIVRRVVTKLSFSATTPGICHPRRAETKHTSPREYLFVVSILRIYCEAFRGEVSPVMGNVSDDPKVDTGAQKPIISSCRGSMAAFSNMSVWKGSTWSKRFLFERATFHQLMTNLGSKSMREKKYEA